MRFQKGVQVNEGEERIVEEVLKVAIKFQLERLFS